MNDLKYPIGPYSPGETYSPVNVHKWIEDIKNLPSQLKKAVYGLSEVQLNTPYRPGGWTVRQVVHHLADSHSNSYCRMKWAFTEENTTIKPYDQERWAELADYEAPVSLSLDLLSALHARWGFFLDSLEEKDFIREYHHPETGKKIIWRHIEHYAWHGKHHLAHITSLAERENWKQPET